MEFKVNKNPTARELKQFGIVMLGGFAVIAGLVYWKSPDSIVSYILLGIGAVIFSIEMALPIAVGRSVYVAWMTAATYMGMVMVPFFLTLLYFILLPPFALIRFKDPLRMKLRADGTYWEKHENHEASLERMRRPF